MESMDINAKPIPAPLNEGYPRAVRAAFLHSHDAILITDAVESVVEVNEAFSRMTGYSRDEAIGQSPRLLRSGQHPTAFYTEMWLEIRATGHWQGELWNHRKNGEVYAQLTTIVEVLNAQGQVSNYVSISTDLTSAKEDQKQLTYLANFDSVTGLPNRALLMERVNADINNAQRNTQSLAMMMISLDQFKSVNSTFGHQAGEQVLVDFGRRLKCAIRHQDAVGRLPGEGFILVLPNMNNDDASLLATKLLDQLAHPPYRIGERELAITPSIGIALYPSDAEDFESLCTCLSAAKQRAQQLGRNNFQFFNRQFHRLGYERMAISAALGGAIIRKQLQLHYQPFMDLQTGKIAGMEALLRWQHPELGAVPPSRFIPIAETNGLIIPLGAWVLRSACQAIRNWQNAGVTVPPVAINVSALQFRDPGLVSHIELVLREFNIDPALIHIELTEGSLMDNVVRTQEALRALKRLGCGLSLDDFGTGYSSLTYLKQFPFDKIKIDQSFVRNILSDKEDAVIANVVVSMAHGLGLRVIAEGVETEEQCAYLRSNMCDEIQGFLFSKAIDAEATLELLKEDRRLPDHLLRLPRRTRTLLFVDDEANILSSLKRLFRRDGYHLLTANSGQEGLEILAQHEVDIIVSDQRMPRMTGVEFLRIAKERFPDTLRIVLSGYTELQSVTDAVNEGAVYRFLTKPWDDEQLREFIAEAFRHKELTDENKELNLKIRTANSELAKNNRQLLEVNAIKQEILSRNEVTLNVLRETLQHLPVPIVGLDDAGMIAFVNAEALDALSAFGPLLGMDAVAVLPDIFQAIGNTQEGVAAMVHVGERPYQLKWHAMGTYSTSKGKIVSLALTAEVP